MQTKTLHPWSFMCQRSGRKYFPDEYSYWRHWAKILNLSSSARLRLEWFIFYYTVGKQNGTLTAKHFGIARQIFVKWKQRFKPRDLTTLEDHSRIPQRKRIWTVTPSEEQQVIALRKQYLKWGKEKLKREYSSLYGLNISTNKIQKIINKHNLYLEPERVKKNRFWDSYGIPMPLLPGGTEPEE